MLLLLFRYFLSIAGISFCILFLTFSKLYETCLTKWYLSAMCTAFLKYTFLMFLNVFDISLTNISTLSLSFFGMFLKYSSKMFSCLLLTMSMTSCVMPFKSEHWYLYEPLSPLNSSINSTFGRLFLSTDR